MTTPNPRPPVTQETSAPGPWWSVKRHDDKAHLLLDNGVVCGSIYHPWNPDDIAAALNAAAPPPFPGAYPGPQVDGQPTWGADYCDIPKDGTYEWSVRPGEWHPISMPPMAGEDYWVKVRRTPQPATERVPWHEAVGRREASSGDTIVQVSAWNSGSQGYWLARDGGTQYEVSGGTVAVLVENEETGT